MANASCNLRVFFIHCLHEFEDISWNGIMMGNDNKTAKRKVGLEERISTTCYHVFTAWYMIMNLDMFTHPIHGTGITFGCFLWYMVVNIPYMDAMGHDAQTQYDTERISSFGETIYRLGFVLNFSILILDFQHSVVHGEQASSHWYC